MDKRARKPFQNIKDRISEETILAVPNRKYQFHIHVDSSSIGTGSILLQEFPRGKRTVSFNSRVFTKDEKKDVNFASRTLWNHIRSTKL